MRKRTTEEWVAKAKEVHRDKYDYSKASYINSRSKISIICPIHGLFQQEANSHLKGSGCPKCGAAKGLAVISGNRHSRGELLIGNLLRKFKINYEAQFPITLNSVARNSNLIIVDFYLNDINTIVEYNGEQHYRYCPKIHRGGKADFDKQLRRDNELKNYCESNGIRLITFSYKDKEDIIYNAIEQLSSREI